MALKGVTWWTTVDRLEPDAKELEEQNGPEDVDTSSQSGDNEEGKCHRWFDFICGIPKSHGGSRDSPEITIPQRREFLKQDPKWQTILNVNAAFSLGVMAFLLGFFK